MNLSRVNGDLERREPIFTITNMQPVTDDLYPIAHVWCGLDKGGSSTEIVPVLFDKSDSVVDSFPCFEQFTVDTDRSNPLRPMVYSENSESLDPIRADLLYRIKPIAEGDIGSPVDTNEDVHEAAVNWKENFAQKTLDYELKEGEHNAFNIRLWFRVYGERFTTQLPIFADRPSEEEFKKALEDVRIPCITIVPDDVNAQEEPKRFETIIEPGIVQLD